jgi:hypothetical protein
MTMEILYDGGSRFVIRGAKTVTIDPAEKQPKDVLALYTTRQAKLKSPVNGPGEYEIGGVLIGTVVVGEPRSKDLAHAITIDDITVCALRGNPESLEPRALDALGHIDVLLLGDASPEVAQKAVSLLEPRVTLAGGDRGVEVAAALGVKDAEPKPKFTWNGVSAAPRAVVLKTPTRSKRAA